MPALLSDMGAIGGLPGIPFGDEISECGDGSRHFPSKVHHQNTEFQRFPVMKVEEKCTVDFQGYGIQARLGTADPLMQGNHADKAYLLSGFIVPDIGVSAIVVFVVTDLSLQDYMKTVPGLTLCKDVFAFGCGMNFPTSEQPQNGGLRHRTQSRCIGERREFTVFKQLLG